MSVAKPSSACGCEDLGGVESDLDVIVDSGFTASLALPVTLVTALGLLRQSGGTAKLADGSVRQFDICMRKSRGQLTAGHIVFW